MGRCLPKCLVAMALVLAAAVAVGAGSTAGRPHAAARGYGRLLAAPAGRAVGDAGKASDCLMATVLVRGQTGGRQGIPEPQFTALREYCRVAGVARDPGQAPAKSASRTPLCGGRCR